MLTVLESAASQDHGHVCGGVLVGIAKITPVEHHTPSKKGFTAVVNSFQLAQQLSEQLHVPHVDCRKLRQLALILAVMRQVMIAVGNLDTVNIDGGRVRAVEKKRDQAG